MRVLMFGWEFPPWQAGGLATATVGLVRGLLRQGLDVTLVVPFPVHESPLPGLRLVGTPDTGGRLAVHRVPSPLEPYGGSERYQEVLAALPDASSRQVYGPDLMAEVDRFARYGREVALREPHDVIDAHDWLTFPAGIAAREASGRPFVAHIHATEYDRAGEHGNQAILEREAHGLAAADRIVSNSHVLKQACVSRFGLPAAKVDVVHWGIEGEALGTAPYPPRDAARRPPTVLFLGRVTWQKGPDYFLDVARRVTRHVPDARFVVAGTGNLLPHIIRRTAELGLASRVLFTGGLQGEDVSRAYRMADVCVMPSVSEPFGLVALESLRHGTPCIVPRTAGVAEVLANAFKVDFWDIDEMTNQVVALLRYPALHQELSVNGTAELAEPRFGLDEPARLTAIAYGRAIATHGGTH